eukprot:1441124-Rhodomonas_salina.1
MEGSMEGSMEEHGGAWRGGWRRMEEDGGGWRRVGHAERQSTLTRGQPPPPHCKRALVNQGKKPGHVSRWVSSNTTAHARDKIATKTKDAPRKCSEVFIGSRVRSAQAAESSDKARIASTGSFLLAFSALIAFARETCACSCAKTQHTESQTACQHNAQDNKACLRFLCAGCAVCVVDADGDFAQRAQHTGHAPLTVHGNCARTKRVARNIVEQTDLVHDKLDVVLLHAGLVHVLAVVLDRRHSRSGSLGLAAPSVSVGLRRTRALAKS